MGFNRVLGTWKGKGILLESAQVNHVHTGWWGGKRSCYVRELVQRVDGAGEIYEL